MAADSAAQVLGSERGSRVLTVRPPQHLQRRALETVFMVRKI